MEPFTPQLESALDADISIEEARGQMNRSVGLGGHVRRDKDV